MPQNLTLFAVKFRVYKWRGKFYKGEKVMQNKEETIGKDVFLFLFVGVALWLLLFQSGLFN